jgi:hypothetical protein
MWLQSSVVLALITLFCTSLWIVQLPQTDTQNVITTKVEVNLVGQVVTSSETTNNSKKNTFKSTNKRFETADFHKKKHKVPQFMLDLYEQATATEHSSRTGSDRLIPDVVRGLTPRTTGTKLFIWFSLGRKIVALALLGWVGGCNHHSYTNLLHT